MQVLIGYESNMLLILGYTFTSKFNTSRFSYSYLVWVLHTKAHITQGNKNMNQKNHMLQKTSWAKGCYTWHLIPPSSLLLTSLISLHSHPLCLCNHAELLLASRADQHNHTSLQNILQYFNFFFFWTKYNLILSHFRITHICWILVCFFFIIHLAVKSIIFV